jgi:AcrR family transcriptional regulator
MPRTIDVDDRRRVVSEAAWRVLVRDGPTEVSVRKVAAEAGLPPSSLRYTFPTQASVRDAAVALLVSRLRERVGRAAATTGGHDGARAILLELLPLDDERRAEMEVTVAFVALALTDPSLRTAHEQTHAAVRDICALALAHLDHPGPGARRATGATGAPGAPGLALHLLAQAPGTDASWAVSALDAHLALRP